jgi:hypothetical protein
MTYLIAFVVVWDAQTILVKNSSFAMDFGADSILRVHHTILVGYALYVV